MSTKKNIEAILDDKGIYVSTTTGVSMLPMLRDRRDTIVVERTETRLKKYDIALYRRGDDYVLHRVIKVLPDSYIIRGDGCVAKERGITDLEVVGKLTAFYRNDKKVDMNGFGYRAYCRFICIAHPFVSLLLWTKAIFGRLLSKRS